MIRGFVRTDRLTVFSQSQMAHKQADLGGTVCDDEFSVKDGQAVCPNKATNHHKDRSMRRLILTNKLKLADLV
jgi:hypothetical protein